MQPTASLHYKVTNNSEANNYSLGLRLVKKKNECRKLPHFLRRICYHHQQNYICMNAYIRYLWISNPLIVEIYALMSCRHSHKSLRVHCCRDFAIR